VQRFAFRRVTGDARPRELGQRDVRSLVGTSATHDLPTTLAQRRTTIETGRIGEILAHLRSTSTFFLAHYAEKPPNDFYLCDDSKSTCGTWTEASCQLTVTTYSGGSDNLHDPRLDLSLSKSAVTIAARATVR
jgi:hypothetical protein